MTISDLDSLSPGIRRARCEKGIGGIYSTKKLIPESLQPRLKSIDLPPALKAASYSYAEIPWLKGSFSFVFFFLFFFVMMIGVFLKEGVKTYIIVRPMSALDSPLARLFFDLNAFSFIVYDKFQGTNR
jgi:hypothetical protein